MIRALLASFLITTSLLAADKPKPLMSEFIGLNTHTVQHKPDLYKDIASQLRDYHGIEWDLGKESDYVPKFPMSRNKVDWNHGIYAKWRAVGATVDVSLMFEQIPAKDWRDLPRDAKAYGKAFASYFGPSHENLVQSMEIGNEPGKFSDADYRSMFEAMSAGLREGDPKLKIVTANMTIHKSDDYSKNIECIKGLEKSYDVINTHSYAQLEPWPTWRRSFPEDPRLPYLTDVQALIDWRNKNAPGKPVWVTEFGYDSSTKTPTKNDEFKKWVGNTDTEQAQYIVRSWLLFSAMDIDRAYLYWFNDNDEPKLHAASGITRNWQPKPSYYAIKHLQATLGEYRFDSKIGDRSNGKAYCFKFVNGKDPRRAIMVMWLGTGTDESAKRVVAQIGSQVEKIERMALKEGPAESLPVKLNEYGETEVTISGTPVYIFLK